MSVQTEFVTSAFDQVFENFRKATESTLQVQQELFRRWASFTPPFPKIEPSWAEQFQKFHKEWTQATAELTRKYLETLDHQYKAGVDSLGSAFQLGEIQDPAELRQKMLELWHKGLDCLKELAEAQMRSFQAGIDKWLELAKKTNP
jgi:hypothetical protein